MSCMLASVETFVTSGLKLNRYIIENDGHWNDQSTATNKKL
jgi:hypothetical protein